MKKVFVVMLDRERAQGLRALRRLGLVHPVPMAGKGEGLETASHVLDEAYRAVGALGTRTAPKGAKPGAPEPNRGLEIVRGTLALTEEAKRLFDESAALVREADRVASWGDFDPALLAELRASGQDLRLVSGPAKSLTNAPEGWTLVPISKGKDGAKALLSAPVGTPLSLPGDFKEFHPADRPLGELKARVAEIAQRHEAIDGVLDQLAAELPAAEVWLNKAKQDHHFESIRSGLDAEGAVAWIEGYIPEADAPKLGEEAAKRGWGFLLDDPADDELPPTKVQNPPALRMIQPVFDFLGTVPNYREYDISGLFLLFFSFFFAMIFGDGGYGSLLLLAGIGMALKAKFAGTAVPDFTRLLLVLAGATVAWGVATASWFGIPFDALPAALRAISIPWINGGNPDSGDNIKVLCFSIGTVQLVIAHAKNVRRDWPSLKLLGQAGQLAMVAGMFFLVLNLVISQERYPVPIWALYTVLGGFVASFVFGSYDGSRGFFRGAVGGIVSSLSNIVSVFLGVVNVFADITSYIRLWAVGLAGAAISQTVNNMAGPMLGHLVLFAFGVLLLSFGHGLNLIMSVLSVIVHGVRLNVLEFSGHLGMEWSGYKYEPFRETASADRAE